MSKSLKSNDSKNTKNSKSKIPPNIQNIIDNENLGVIREEKKAIKLKQSNSSSKKKSSAKQSTDKRTEKGPNISKDGFLLANNAKSASRPSVNSMMSEEQENKEMVWNANIRSSAKDITLIYF